VTYIPVSPLLLAAGAHRCRAIYYDGHDIRKQPGLYNAAVCSNRWFPFWVGNFNGACEMSSWVRLVIPEAPPPAVGAAGKQRDLKTEGIRLGILDNSKGNADHLLKFIVEGVKAQIKVASVVSLRKPSPSVAAEKAVLDELTEKADCVISAMAD